MIRLGTIYWTLKIQHIVLRFVSKAQCLVVGELSMQFPFSEGC